MATPTTSRQPSRRVELGPGEAGDEPRRREHADRLADHQAGDDADHHRVADQLSAAGRARRRRTSSAKNGTARLEETGDQQVLVGARPGSCSSPSSDAPGSAGRARHRRWSRGPRSRARAHQPAPRSGRRATGVVTRRCWSSAHASTAATATASQTQVQVVGEEHRDDHDRDEVVDDGERQQERPQRGRQVGADDGQHRQRERDVGGGRDRPALGAVRRAR